MRASITPPAPSTPEIRVQPSMLSVPSAANTVAPERESAEPRARPPGARRRLWFFTALGMLAGVAGASLLRDTEQASVEVRSGSPGYRLTEDGQRQHWHSPTLTIYLDESLQRLDPRASEAVMQAFGRWAESDPGLPDLRFDTGKTRSAPERDGRSTISYQRIEIQGHERDLAITVSYANRKNGEIVEADIVLNALYPFGVLSSQLELGSPREARTGEGSPSGGRDKHTGDNDIKADGEAADCRERYDLQNVVTHEAGHFFGLGEDPVEQRAAMFQTIDRCETHKRALSTTDVSAVSTLYAPGSAAPETVQSTAAGCALGATAGNDNAAWLGSVLVGLLAYRRRRAAGQC